MRDFKQRYVGEADLRNRRDRAEAVQTRGGWLFVALLLISIAIAILTMIFSWLADDTILATYVGWLLLILVSAAIIVLLVTIILFVSIRFDIPLFKSILIFIGVGILLYACSD